LTKPKKIDASARWRVERDREFASLTRGREFSPLSPFLFISCFRSSDQEPGREASERGTVLFGLSKDGSMLRGTKDGFAAFDDLLGGRRTEDVFPLFQPLASNLWPQVLQGRTGFSLLFSRLLFFSRNGETLKSKEFFLFNRFSFFFIVSQCL